MQPVLTLTLNPAVDLSAKVPNVVANHKLRCTDVERDPGGGGLNVARVICTLGGRAVAVWTRGGTTGQMLEELLEREDVAHRAVPVRGSTRENFTVFEQASGAQFRFNLPGPSLGAEELARIEEQLLALATGADYLVISGSLPPGAAPTLYADLAAKLSGALRVVVDTSGEALHQMRGKGVFLLKPNLRELSLLVGRPLESDAAIAAAAGELLDDGTAEVIVVSLGAAGAHLFNSTHDYRVPSPTVPQRSQVGAGDSMLGGILHGLGTGRDLVEAVRLGVAAGSAAVMTEGTRLCTREDTERLYGELRAAATAAKG